MLRQWLAKWYVKRKEDKGIKEFWRDYKRITGELQEQRKKPKDGEVYYSYSVTGIHGEGRRGHIKTHSMNINDVRELVLNACGLSIEEVHSMVIEVGNVPTKYNTAP